MNIIIKRTNQRLYLVVDELEQVSVRRLTNYLQLVDTSREVRGHDGLRTRFHTGLTGFVKEAQEVDDVG